MDIGKSLTYMFEDEKWANKVVVGAVVNMVPLLNFASAGYMLATLRNVANDVIPPLPTWDDFGDYFIKGLVLFMIGLIYALPLLLLACCPMSATFLLAFSETGEMAVTEALSIAILGLFALLALLYTLAYTFVMPAVMLHYASAEDFSAAFRLGKIFAFIRDNVNSYLKAWLYVLVVGIVVGIGEFMVGAILGWIPICGWIIFWIIGLGVAFWTYLVVAHVYGQFAREVQLPLRPASAIA
ncbi:MAG: DUF4013 domain-containing protein [Chloroflexi bacterium]|nr:DUF4013 domain-containing protein [Chloroflexota bacterium]